MTPDIPGLLPGGVNQTGRRNIYPEVLFYDYL